MAAFFQWPGLRAARLHDKAVYCEHAPADEDVLYSGSEDDHYDSPSQRRLRYEEAAQIFLTGRLPVLLSTRRGPFTKASGWQNPWAGHRKTRPAPELPVATVQTAPPTKKPSYPCPQPELGNGISKGVSPTTRASTADSNITTGELTAIESDPDDRNLERVESWRQEVSRQLAPKEKFWVPANNLDPSPPNRKRKDGSEWLRREAVNKRLKLTGAASSMLISPTKAKPMDHVNFMLSKRSECHSAQGPEPKQTDQLNDQPEATPSSPSGRAIESEDQKGPQVASRRPNAIDATRMMHGLSSKPRMSSLTAVLHKRTLPDDERRSWIRAFSLVPGGLRKIGPLARPKSPAVNKHVKTAQNATKGQQSSEQEQIPAEEPFRPHFESKTEVQCDSRSQDLFESRQDASFLFRAKKQSPNHDQGVLELDALKADMDQPSYQEPHGVSANTSSANRLHAQAQRIPDIHAADNLEDDSGIIDEYEDTTIVAVDGDAPKQYSEVKQILVDEGIAGLRTESAGSNDILVCEKGLANAIKPPQVVVETHARVLRSRTVEIVCPPSSRTPEQREQPFQIGETTLVESQQSTQQKPGIGSSFAQSQSQCNAATSYNELHSFVPRYQSSPLPQPSPKQSGLTTEGPKTPLGSHCSGGEASATGNLETSSPPRLGTQEQSPWMKLGTPIGEAEPPQSQGKLTLSSSRQLPTPTVGTKSVWDIPSSPMQQPSSQDSRRTSRNKTLVRQSPWGAEGVTVWPHTAMHLPQTPEALRSSPSLPGQAFTSDIGAPGIGNGVSSSAARPSTPETKQLSLPTPDITLSIKPFRRFVSESPERPRRAVPSALRSSLCNPWAHESAKSSKAGRRVRFHLDDKDQPGKSEGRKDDIMQIDIGKDSSVRSEEPDNSADECYIEAGLPKSKDKSTTSPAVLELLRPCSPPPAVSLSTLPKEVEKFQHHFQVVAGRRDLMTPKPVRPLLPASQQAPSSPPTGAMAERFIETDEATKLTVSEGLPMSQPSNSSNQPPQMYSERQKNFGLSFAFDATDDSQVDDVTDVLMNLDSFVGGWDVDAEVARAGKA
jgi:hypothetical protein